MISHENGVVGLISCLFKTYFCVSLQWDFLPIQDNENWHTHKYKVSIYTGTKAPSLKGAKVKMTTIGESGQTGPRLLEDGKRTVSIYIQT